MLILISITTQVMVHQFGHMLGLAHTNRITSAMVPFYTDWVNIF